MNLNSKKPEKRPLYVYYIIAVVIIVLLNVFALPALSERSVKETDYTTFLKAVDRGKVYEATINSDYIYYTMKVDGNDVYCKTVSVEDQDLVSHLYDAGVSIEGTAPQRQSLLLSLILGYVLPIADLLLLNFLCILCCIPVVTAGASITALYYVTLKMARDEESYIARSFFRSFKQNFKQATIINIIMLLTAAVLFIDLRIARAGSGAMYKGLFSLFIAFALIYAMILLYIYPILSKFFNSVKNTFVNAFLMSVRHLPLTLLMLVISASPLLLMWLFAYVSYAQFTSILIMLFILMGFSTLAYWKSKIFVKIFDNYIPKDENEENGEEKNEPKEA